MRLKKFKIFDFFYRAFHAWPKFYEGITQLFSFGQWERWEDRVFEDIVGKKVLEIGVGPGKLLLKLAKKGYTVTGIELREGMAYEARRRVKKAGLDIDIIQQPVYKMPFQNESFDTIVLTFCLAEIDRLDAAIIEMKRVLKKGGKVIVIAGGMPQDRNWVAKVLFRMVSFQTTLYLERDNKSAFEKHGFSVTRTDFGPFNIVHKIVAFKP